MASRLSTARIDLQMSDGPALTFCIHASQSNGKDNDRVIYSFPYTVITSIKRFIGGYIDDSLPFQSGKYFTPTANKWES